MFEIGNSLREARLRQGLEMPRIEAETKIRAKYLKALEEERFEVLPGDTYVKGFLRTYADYLGLDGQLYVDEFNSRFFVSEEPIATPAANRRRRPRRSESNLVIVALAGIVAVTILVVVGLGEIGSDGDPARAPLTPPTTTETTPAATVETDTGTTTDAAPADDQPAAQRKRFRLVLTAVGGDCWLQVRAGGVGGRLLYEGTLEDGQSQRFLKQRRLWIELGAPANLRAKLNGRVVQDFPDSPSIVVVTAKGVRVVSRA